MLFLSELQAQTETIGASRPMLFPAELQACYQYATYEIARQGLAGDCPEDSCQW